MSSPKALAAVLLLAAAAISTEAARLNRSQRQVATRELASGLTGAGTSFNSLYAGQYDPSLYPDQQQSVLNSPYDDTRYSALDGDYYGAKGALPGAFPGVGYNPADPKDAAYGLDYMNQGWRGFGANKGPYGRGRSQFGVKY